MYTQYFTYLFSCRFVCNPWHMQQCLLVCILLNGGTSALFCLLVPRIVELKQIMHVINDSRLKGSTCMNRAEVDAFDRHKYYANDKNLSEIYLNSGRKHAIAFYDKIGLYRPTVSLIRSIRKREATSKIILTDTCDDSTPVCKLSLNNLSFPSLNIFQIMIKPINYIK